MPAFKCLGSRAAVRTPASRHCRFMSPRRRDVNSKKIEEEPKGYFDTIRDIMRMPATTADPTIPTQRVDAAYCAKNYTKSPRNVTMLTRDFIGDSLYNPAYGYFSKQALIFSPQTGYDFGSFRDSAQLLKTMGQQYEDIERELDDVRNIPRQLWHTPTEILKPWYGYSVANHIIKAYKRDFAGAPLVIYEMGGGNGTLMMNVLDYICEREPEIYSQMEYNLVEISTKLAKKQLHQHMRQQGTTHANVNIINQSILEWKRDEKRQCFFIAMEVIDNFAHDVVRYDYDTGMPYQAFVRVYGDGEFEEYYEPVQDPVIQDYLEVRSSLTEPRYQSPAIPSPWYRKLRSQAPFAPNMTKREFLPTTAFQLCRVLAKYFSNHKLVLSDFYKLPDTIPGAVDAPVVQTRFNNSMVPCETYLVQPGWFDIFFPTNFELLQRIYASVCDRPSSQVCSQRQFAKENADLAKTRTRSGENPMLDFYENNKFLLS